MKKREREKWVNIRKDMEKLLVRVGKRFNTEQVKSGACHEQ